MGAINSIRFLDGGRIELDPKKSIATFHDIQLLDKIFSADRDLKMCADFEAATLPCPWEMPLIGSPWGDAITLLEATMATDTLLLVAEKCRNDRQANKVPQIQISANTVALLGLLIYAKETMLSQPKIKDFKQLTVTTDKGNRVSWSLCRLRIQAACQALCQSLAYAEQSHNAVVSGVVCCR